MKDSLIEEERPKPHTRYLPCNDRVIITTPHFHTIIVTRRYMPDDVNFFLVEFGALQLVDEPLKLFGRIRTVEQQPPEKKSNIMQLKRTNAGRVLLRPNDSCLPIQIITNIHIERNNAKSRPHKNAVKSALANSSRS